ncbi:MAG: D-aminoacyl-tRNA deacylase [bacterium]|nr:D-aminoacyl-tRNA deacylase [bacterium]
MRALIQRTAECRVEVDGKQVSATGPGILVLLGIAEGDGGDNALYLARKTAQLRIFEDQDGKMNRSILQSGGEAMVVSQFTLVADTGKGNRPGFGQAMAPGPAEALYRMFISELEGQGIIVSTGVFGASMKVTLVNDGPVTFLLESRKLEKKRVLRAKSEERRAES